MSNYLRNTRHPITGKFESAEWLDDYYGKHRYGVRFPGSDEVFIADSQEWEFDDEPEARETHNPVPPDGCNCASFWTIRGSHKADCPLHKENPVGKPGDKTTAPEAGEPDMTNEEIQAEIDASRREGREAWGEPDSFEEAVREILERTNGIFTAAAIHGVTWEGGDLVPEILAAHREAVRQAQIEAVRMVHGRHQITCHKCYDDVDAQLTPQAQGEDEER